MADHKTFAKAAETFLIFALQLPSNIVSLNKHSAGKCSKLQTWPACNPLAIIVNQSNMNLFLRQAELKDAKFICELSEQLGYKTTVEKIQYRLSEILKNADNCIYVITDNENTIGWVHGFYTLRVESDSFVEIGGLVVHENYRKKGIGKMLVKKVIEWAASKKSNQIRVRVNVFRKETHQFYNNIGFIERKEQKIFDMKLD